MQSSSVVCCKKKSGWRARAACGCNPHPTTAVLGASVSVTPRSQRPRLIRQGETGVENSRLLSFAVDPYLRSTLSPLSLSAAVVDRSASLSEFRLSCPSSWLVLAVPLSPCLHPGRAYQCPQPSSSSTNRYLSVNWTRQRKGRNNSPLRTSYE